MPRNKNRAPATTRRKRHRRKRQARWEEEQPVFEIDARQMAQWFGKLSEASVDVKRSMLGIAMSIGPLRLAMERLRR